MTGDASKFVEIQFPLSSNEFINQPLVQHSISERCQLPFRFTVKNGKVEP
jgi:hypothetical protein